MIDQSTTSASRSSLRKHLMTIDEDLATAANRTWHISCEIHDRQTRIGGNVDGRKHVEQVEQNIWRLLSKSREPLPGTRLNLERFSPQDLYLLSCAACCHDFDKGLHNAVLGEDFRHGEGSGKFVRNNWEKLSIAGRGNAEYIDWIVSIHDCKEDFDARLQLIPISRGMPPLRCLATLLKAADTLHMDETRIARIAVPDESLTGFVRLIQLARGCIRGWGIDGSRIVVTVSIQDEETLEAVSDCVNYIQRIEWPPIERNLREHQFPHYLYFDFLCSGDLKRILSEQDMIPPKKINVVFESMASLTGMSSPKSIKLMSSEEPLKIVAVRPEDLGDYLCETGPLSVIDNLYVEPELTELGEKRGAISRIFVGPANCGKTRAAYEWIRKKIGVNSHDWVVLRPESGSIPQNASGFSIDWRSRYGDQRRRPRRVLLFVDDLPEYLPTPGAGQLATEAVHRLFVWFRDMGGFTERCFVGTIRLERMVDKPDWPEKLQELGEDLLLLRVEALGEDGRGALWKGLESARGDLKDGVRTLELELDEDFIEKVATREADPEAICYFARTIAGEDTKRLSVKEAERFSEHVVEIWLRETWPAIREAYGAVASVFFTLARLFEGGIRSGSVFRSSLPPAWDYHAVYGSALMTEQHEKPDDYLPGIERLLVDGHAAGVKAEWIRPKFDFLLQATSLEDVEVVLPPIEWFALRAKDLKPHFQAAMSFYFSCASNPFTREGATAHWLFGHAMAMDFLAAKDEMNNKSFLEEEIHTYTNLVQRYGEDQTPGVREAVASGMFNQGVTLGKLGRDEEAMKTYRELAQRYGEDQTPGVREAVAKGMVNQGVSLGKLGRDEEAVETYRELAQRYGEDQTPGVREQVMDGEYTSCSVLIRLWRKTQKRKYLNQAVSVGRSCVAQGGKCYNLACALAMKKEIEEAFQLLTNALDKGEIEWSWVEGDADWEELRCEPVYVELKQKYQ